MRVSRRDFLVLSGVGLGSVLASRSLPAQASRALAPATGELGILYDASKCVGCRACQMACKRWNSLPSATTDPQKLYETPQDLSADTWTMIRVSEVSQTDWHFFNYQCMHCTDAACVTVCPSGALFRHERGFTAYDRNKCIGCGYCTQFCPYTVPHLKTTNVFTGEAKIGKCTFCQDRIDAGIGGPICAESCPVGALVWGQRADLLKQAKERVATLQAQGLASVRLYGENEADGLHRLSILFGDVDRYHLPASLLSPLTARLWKDVVHPLGGLALGGTLLALAGAWFVIRRNIRMEEVE